MGDCANVCIQVRGYCNGGGGCGGDGGGGSGGGGRRWAHWLFKASSATFVTGAASSIVAPAIITVTATATDSTAAVAGSVP